MDEQSIEWAKNRVEILRVGIPSKKWQFCGGWYQVYQSHVEFYGEAKADFCHLHADDGHQKWCIFTVKDTGAPSTDLR